MTTTEKAKRETAAEAHNRTLDEINEKIIRLQKYLLLENVEGFKQGGETNWGYVGDLGRINALLRDALGDET